MSGRVEEGASAALVAAAALGLSRHETLEAALLMVERLMLETGAPEAVRYFAIGRLKAIPPRSSEALEVGTRLIDREGE
jgi:hypothetical protein